MSSFSSRPSVRISGQQFVPWLLVICVLVFFSCIRWRLRDMPLERDEGEYAYAGQLMLQGVPPYKIAHNMKLPGTFAVYAASMAVFGQTIEGIRLGLLVANAITSVLIFLLARKLFNPWTGVIACASYGMLSTSPAVLGVAAHANHFVVLFAMAGLLALLHALDSEKNKTLFVSGLLFGLTFLMKQHGLVFGLFGAAWLALHLVKKKTRPAPALVFKKLLLFSSGCALPFLLTCLLLWQAGVFSQFWFWTFSYASHYATSEPLNGVWGRIQRRSQVAVPPNEALWIVAAIGLILSFFAKQNRRPIAFVVGLFIFSLPGFAAGFYFRQHYFILLLPAVSLFIGIAVKVGLELIRRPVAPAIFLAAYGLVFFMHRDFFFRLTPVEICRNMYAGNPFTETMQVAQFIREYSSPDDKIAVVGSEPQIYFYAQRRSATGYIYVYPLMENHPFALKMQLEMISEIEKERPAFLVFVGIPFSWIVRHNSDRTILNWFDEYSQRHYEMVATLTEDDETKFETDSEGNMVGHYIHIFKRK